MKRIFKILFLALTAIVAVLPLLQASGGLFFGWLTMNMIAGFNFAAWSIVVAFILAREDLFSGVKRAADRMGMDVRNKSLEKLVDSLIHEVNRKNSTISINLIERRIESQQELSQTLERIVGLTYRLFSAESAELALFDNDSGLYHSSFILGKPFRSSAQAMLSGAAEGEDIEPTPDVLIQPILFAGTVLGSLRVSLKRNTLPTNGDREIMRLLALQSSLALINSQYTTELLRMKRASEETMKAKTGFLANLSHEIRGPLGVILNAVELVGDGLCGETTADQTEILGMAKKNGEHLLELVNDVLDYAKVESGKITPKRISIPVDSLLKDMTSVVRVQAEAKSHKIVAKATEEDIAIFCDRRHIRQMLINMLTNAIKYTPEGGRIEAWAERATGGKIKIFVKDTGIGIREDDYDKVFQAFERIENKYSMTQVGTGLGMPLTKRLAEVNGARIGFSSKTGEGTTFWLLFEEARFEAIETTKEEQPVSAQIGNGEHILLLAKKGKERDMYARYLQHAGFKISSAGSVEKTHDRLKNSEIQLAIIDNDVTENSKDEIVKELREEFGSKTTPIILLSSRGFVFDIEKYLKAGVDRCVTKPVELKKLGKVCRELLDLQVMDREFEEKKSEADPKASRVVRLVDIVH